MRHKRVGDQAPHEEVDPREFRRILDEDGGERAVAAYLREHPWIAYWTLCPASGHDRYAFCEFPLGSRYKVDLVLLNSYSGAWEAHSIELEPATDRIFTAARQPAKRLAMAQRQVNDWQTYVAEHRRSVIDDFLRWAKKYDRLGYSDGDDPSKMSGDRLADPNTVVLFNYHIIIGRSSTISAESRRSAGEYHLHHHINVVTYDRLLDLAERRYGPQSE